MNPEWVTFLKRPTVRTKATAATLYVHHSTHSGQATTVRCGGVDGGGGGGGGGQSSLTNLDIKEIEFPLER